MTDPAPSPQDDLQRPLEEGWPEGFGEPAVGGDEPAPTEPALVASELTVVGEPALVATEADPPADDPPADDDSPPADDPPADDGEPATTLRPAVPTAAVAIRSHRATAPLALVTRSQLVRGVHALRLMPGRAARGFLAWARRPTGRFALPATLIGAMLLAGALGGAAVVPATGASSAGAGAGEPTAAPTPVPSGTRPPGPVPPIIDPELSLPGNPSDGLRSWADQVAERTGIPVVAVLAYGYAELVVAHTTPECNLSWTTLAAIGRVESNHGHSGDSSLLPDGRALPPIYGDPLDGEGGRMLIPDTDGGELDSDDVYDRAVGPMQFIPETWRLEAIDADGDGVADVHNIHDAALAAANYLCRGDRDLTVPADWWAAIHSYNNVTVYANAVFDAANEYGQRSRP